MALLDEFVKLLCSSLDEDIETLLLYYYSEGGGGTKGTKEIFQRLWPKDLYSLRRGDCDGEPALMLAFVARSQIPRADLIEALRVESVRLAAKAEASDLLREWREDDANATD